MEAILTGELEREATEIGVVARLGMVVNIGLSLAKLSVGYLVGSLALIADGFNSLTDILTDIALLIGTALGAKPADENHPYGHGKIETFVALIVDVGILAVGGGIIYSAVSSLLGTSHLPHNGWAVVAISAATIVVKEWLFHRTSKVADRCRSAALHGKAWDHRSDVAVAAVVLAGGIGSVYGWAKADAIAGLSVGVVVLAVGGRLIFDLLIELTEGSAGKETEQKIDEILGSFEEVRGWHRLRTRRIGRELLMDVHIVLDRSLSIEDGHKIVLRIEEAIGRLLDWPVNLTIHIDPDNADILEARFAAGDKTIKQLVP